MAQPLSEALARFASSVTPALQAMDVQTRRRFFVSVVSTLEHVANQEGSGQAGKHF